MRTKSVLCALALTKLVIIFLSLPVLALEERREVEAGSYEKIRREVRLSAGVPVSAFCEPGDTLVESFCDGKNQEWLPVRTHSVDFVGIPENGIHGIHVKAIPVKQAERSGVNCQAEVIHPEQILRVDAHVICRSRP